MDHELETFITRGEDINDTVKWIRYHFLAEKGRIPFHHLCQTLCHLPNQEAAAHLFASFAGLTLAPNEELPLNVAISYSDVANGLQQQPSSSSLECSEEDYLTTAILIDLSDGGSVSFEDFIAFMQLAHDALDQDPSNARTCFNTFYDCLKERLRTFLPQEISPHQTMLEQRLITMAEKMRLSGVPTLPLMALAHFTDKKAAENELMTVTELMNFMTELEGKPTTASKLSSSSFPLQSSLSSPTPVPEPATGKNTGYTPMREKANELIDDFFNFASTTNVPSQSTNTNASVPHPTTTNNNSNILPSVVTNTTSTSSNNSSSNYAAAMLDFPSPPQKPVSTVQATMVDNNDLFSSKDPFANMGEQTKEVKSEVKEMVNTATVTTTNITNDSKASVQHKVGEDTTNHNSPTKTTWAVSDPLEAFPSPPITPKLPPLQTTTVGDTITTSTVTTENSTSFASPVAATSASAAAATTTVQGRLPTASPSAGYTRTFPSPAGLPFDGMDSNHHHNNQANTTRINQLFTESTTNESASSSASNSTKSAQTSQHEQKAVTITKRRISAMTLKPPPLTNVPMTDDTMDDGLGLVPPPPPPASSSPVERRESQARGHVPPKGWYVPPVVPVTTSPVAVVVSSTMVDPVVAHANPPEPVISSTSTSTMPSIPIIPTYEPNTPIINNTTVTNESLTNSRIAPVTSSLSDHVQMLRKNVEVLSAKMADQKEDVEMSLELWSILKELEEQLKTTTAGGVLVAAGGSVSGDGGSGGGKGTSTSTGGMGTVANTLSIGMDGKEGENDGIRGINNDGNMRSSGDGGNGNSTSGHDNSGSSNSSSSIQNDRNHSNAVPISSNTTTNTNVHHNQKPTSSSSSEMDQMYQPGSPGNGNYQQQQQPQYNRNNNNNNNNNNNINNNSHKKQSTLRQSAASSGGGSPSKHRNRAPQSMERFEKNGRSYQSPAPQRIQHHKCPIRTTDLSMDTTGTNQSHLCIQNQTNTTITTNHTSSSSVPNLSIFKSPMAKYRPAQKNMYDERSREWKKPPSLHTQQPNKFQERFQYPADIARWTKLNAMLKPL